MTETANQGDYTLDSGIIRLKGWQWAGSGTYSSPEPVGVDELLRLRAAGVSAGAWPASYYAVQGNLLMVYPTPSAADTITIYCTPRPTAMSAGTHDPSSATYGGIPSEFHPAIERYALWKLGSADDDQSSAQGERYRIEYEGSDGTGGWVKTIRKYANAKGKPPRAIVNAHRRRRAYHDNSIWP